jgi:hypothetical protein
MAEDPETWTELKASVAEWLNRSDLTSKIPEFIALAERKFNRIIVTPERESTATASLSGETLGLAYRLLAASFGSPDDRPAPALDASIAFGAAFGICRPDHRQAKGVCY